MNIEVTRCNHCPFMYYDFDPDAMGADTCMICTLALHLRMKDTIIDCFNTYFLDKDDQLPPSKPEWCPLNNQSVTVKLS